MKAHIESRVTQLFGGGELYCAETVLKVIAEIGGKDADSIVRMATGFCSGMSRTSGQCGAVSGAVMGIGLFAGRMEVGGEYEPAYALVQEFLERFEQQCGSINCFELVGCDFGTPEGRAQFKEDELLSECILYAVFAVETAVDLLREHGYLSESSLQGPSWGV